MHVAFFRYPAKNTHLIRALIVKIVQLISEKTHTQQTTTTTTITALIIIIITQHSFALNCIVIVNGFLVYGNYINLIDFRLVRYI